MSLLPNNSSLKEQKFAELFDSKSRVDYSDLKIDVMSCDKSILPHVALMIGANIDNMLENEVRRYLKTFTKKAVGTVGAVEDAISSTLDNAELVEWYQDEEKLDVGFFGVTVQVQNDSTKKYDERLFSITARLINSSKNVRSKFDSFNLTMPLIGTSANISVTSSTNLKLKNDLTFKDSAIQIINQVGGMTNIKMNNELQFKESLVQINIKGAGVWTV